jgi:hypothetical protein
MKVAYIDLSLVESGLAEASIDFLFFETLKPEFQSLINYLAILPKLERYRKELTEGAHIMAMDIQEELGLPHNDKFINDVAKALSSIYSGGTAYVYHPAVNDYVLIWVLDVDDPVGSFYRFATAVLIRYIIRSRINVEMAYISLAEDTKVAPLVDYLVEALEKLGPRDSVKSILLLVEMAPKYIVTGLSEVMVLNYFILLNTKPFENVYKMCTVASETLFHYACYNIDYVRVVIIENLLNMAKQLTSLPKDITEKLHRLADEATRSITGEVPTPRFASVAHSIYESAVVEHPKNVYLGNKLKYEVIFRNINWDAIRRKGVPALDSM